jgi:hypothetical protein
MIAAPIGMLFVILATSACLLYGFYLIVTSVAAQYDQSVCSNCGYDLRGRQDASRCPECGGEFTQTELRIERKPMRMIAGLCVVALSGAGMLAGAYLSMLLK